MESYTFRKNTRYKIMTPAGYQNFGGIRKLNKNVHYIVELSNKKILKCSTTHPFIYNDREIFANKLKVGSLLDSTSKKKISVISIELDKSKIDLYDIVEVNNGNIFNVDGIVSHNCDFISSGQSVIAPELLQFYKQTFVQEPMEKGGFDGNLWKWEYPDYNRSYMVVADVSRGDAADFSACHVIDIESATQVAEYKGKLSTKDYGNFLVSLATDYNEALLVVENANIGWAVIQQIIDRDYQNLFYMSKDLKYVDTQRQINNKYRADDKGLVAGFATTTKTRPLIISKLDLYFREKSVTIRSMRCINELETFIWSGNRAEAMRGFNDDLTMSLAIGLWVRDTALRLRQEGVDLTKSAIGGISQETTESGIYTGAGPDIDPWKMKINGEDEDLSWLI